MKTYYLTGLWFGLLTVQLFADNQVLQTGRDWIANAMTKVRVETEDTAFRKSYCLTYYRWDNKKKDWHRILAGLTPVRGMGSNLLGAGITTHNIHTTHKNGIATLIYRLEGMSSKPKKPIWVEYKVTLLKNNPSMIIQLNKRSHPELTMMVHAVPITSTRYLFYDQFKESSSYSITRIDAADKIKGAFFQNYKYTKFTATYSPNRNYVAALFALPGDDSPKSNLLALSSGVGYGTFIVYHKCAVFGKILDSIKGIDTVEHYIENQFYMFQKSYEETLKL